MTAEEIEDIKAIHNAIHDMRAKYVELHGKRYSILNSVGNGCRYIEYQGIKYMEQNPNKESKWADRVRMGDLITWGIRPGKWLLIINGEIK